MAPGTSDQKKSGSAALFSPAGDSQAIGIRGRYIRELIPPNAGSGPHRKIVQAQTLAVWTLSASIGVFVFHQPWFEIGPEKRAAALGLVFPGAGYLASANILGGILFALTLLATPPALFAWFGAGAIFFPILVWVASIVGAFLATGDTVWEPAGRCAPAILALGFLYANRHAARERARDDVKRGVRNEFLPEALAEIDRFVAAESTRDEDEEVDLETLRWLQHVIDMSFQSFDDWSGFNIIDQFQTAAVRYQIYQIMYALGLYQTTFAPNVHGYISESFRRTIERSLTKKVLNFWKWERLAGKFSLDWDPIQKDNIMVSGFLLQGVMLYTSITGDLRYTEPESLVFNITDNLSYKYSVHDLQKTLIRQWAASPYCLIPCEPNWIYVICNLQGMTGAVIYDRYFGTRSSEVILPIFEESLNTNFTEKSGSVLPIRGELTGFSIPGLCGATGDLAAVMLGCGPLKELSRRLWAVLKKERIQYDRKTGDLSLTGLVGADVIDVGNYKKNAYAMYPSIAAVAGEYGDKKLKQAATDKFEKAWGVVTHPSGAKSLDPAKASTVSNLVALTARLIRPGAYHRMSMKGIPEVARNGPILSEVPYPGVLVAKARSHTSRDLELVLYPSSDAGTFSLGITRLQPSSEYSYGGKKAKSDKNGYLKISQLIDGRTHLHIKLMGE